MPYGYIGKILRVNLSYEKLSTEELGDAFYRRYFGGRGMIGYFLLRELAAGIDPLSPENKLIFATGPVTGVPISGSGRNSVGAKSPLTGGYGEAEVGGYWGAELKRAGFDAIIFEGRASSPVYLWVTDGTAEIRDADHLWGKDTGEALKTIREESGERFARFAGIGIGGENLVRYACIINDLKDAAGRTGLGAVMGSKRLKAIAVRGHEPVDIVNKDVLLALNRKIVTEFPGFTKNLHDFGTGATMTKYAQNGNLPTRNFRDGNFENPEGISAQTIKKTISVGMDSCWACGVRCKKVVKLEEPWSVDPEYGGPEYETLAALGSCCGIDDLKTICKANELCNRYSIDTISIGVTIAFAMECFENGLLTENDTDGLKLTFGNSDAMLKMVEKIARRDGLGSILAEGTKRAAQKIGKRAEMFAMHVKGQELPMHEPRLKWGLGLGYAVSPTGADHSHNIHDTDYTLEEQMRPLNALGLSEPLPPDTLGPKKVRLFTYLSIWRSLYNCLVTCRFVEFTPVETVNIVNATTGWDTTVWELMKVSERAINLARLFNIREGLTADDDRLPERFFQPQTSGPLSKTALDKDEFDKAKRLYYGMMGWDPDTGIPTRAKLEELDIAWAT
jgi:aldehyde:ferredoxin oxidoreductase